MPRLLTLLTLAFLALAGPAVAASRTKVELVNLTADVRPGERALVAVRFVCDEHFHIYWKNPGDAGQSPAISWKQAAGTSPGPLLYPGPTLLDQKGVYNFVHELETLLLVELSIPAEAKGELGLAAHVEWLECDDKGCYPFEKDVALTLKVGPGNPTAKHDPNRYGDRRPAVRATYVIAGDQLTVTPPVDAKLELSKAWFPERGVVSAEGVFTQKHDATKLFFNLKDAPEKPEAGPVVFVAQDARGVWWRVEATAATGSAAPAPTKPTDGASAKGGAAGWLPWSPEAQAAALAAGRTVYVDFTAEWCATCQINKRVYKHESVAQALADKGVVLLKADWTRKDATIAAELAKYGRSGVPCNVFLKQGAPAALLSEVISDGEVLAALDTIAAGKAYRAEDETHVYAVWLLLAFGGGALLNLMPCVFPVIGLKVLGFAREAGADRGAVIRHGLLYALGVVLSFLALGGLILALKAGGSSIGWGFQMQSPGFVLGTCILMVTLGLSLAGVFEIGTGLAGRAAGAEDRGGAVGAFLSGVLATAVATPCTAPGLRGRPGLRAQQGPLLRRDPRLLPRHRAGHGVALPAARGFPPPDQPAAASGRMDGDAETGDGFPAFRLRALPPVGAEHAGRRPRLGARHLPRPRGAGDGLLDLGPVGRAPPHGPGAPLWQEPRRPALHPDDRPSLRPPAVSWTGLATKEKARRTAGLLHAYRRMLRER
jgi:thiol:disulfide interchange protein DsbD